MHREAFRLALVFPGQGAQYPGMGQDLVRDFPVARALQNDIATAFRRLDPAFDLPAIMTSAVAEDLLRTDLCQAAVFAHSAMAWVALEQELRSTLAAGPPVAALGHSFGELTAHLAAGTLDLTSMSAIVLSRGRLMLEAPDGALLNVEGLNRQELRRLLREYGADKAGDQRVHIAISQAPRLNAVGGLPDGVARFASFLREHGVSCRTVKGVHKPLHTPFQRDVRSRFQDMLLSVTFRLPRFPVVSTARGAFHVRGQAVQELAAQIDSEMRFCKALERIAKLNPDLYVVCGPGSKIAELLAHYNAVHPQQIRVVERGAQIRALVAELSGGGSNFSVPRDRPSRQAGWTYVKGGLRGFEKKRESYCLFEPDGRPGPFEEALDRSATLIFYKGSFNPIHSGHVALFEAARRRHPGALGVFSLSVHTAKKYLARREILSRASLILRAGYPVVLNYSGYFADNVAWLRARAPWLRLVLPVGVDALRHLVEYYSPEDFASHFSDVLFEHAERELTTHSHPQAQAHDHPAYAGFRPVRLEPKFFSLSSSAIRAWATAGREDLIRTHIPTGAAERFLRRWTDRT